jgi:hypothetical protein
MDMISLLNDCNHSKNDGYENDFKKYNINKEFRINYWAYWQSK